MRILFAIKGMNDAKGGAERVLADVSGALADRGHEAALLTFDAGDRPTFYPLSPRIRRIGLASGDVRASATLKETVSRVPRIRKIVKDEKPDVVVAFMHSMFVPASAACAGLGVPFVASEHIVPMHYRERPVERLLLNATAPLIDRYTVLSESIRETYPPHIRKKMSVMPNPVRQATLRADAGGQAFAEKSILSVGRLEPQKDFTTLIEAFSLLTARFPDWRLNIIGEGSEQDKLQALIDRNGLQGRISLLSPTAEIEKAYAGAQIFALSSRYESFGLVTAEAMSHGLPAIGFADCPGTNELIADGVNGLLVKPDQNRASAFARGLERLMANPAQRRVLGTEGIKTAKLYALESVTDRWETLLASVVTR